VRTRTLLLLLLVASCGAAADGERAYREGRFKDAAEAYARADAAAGDGASAELLLDEALAALRAGDLSRAESCADRAARRGAESAALADFVKGNAAFARAAVSEMQADRVEAEPFAFDAAIAQAETARDAWIRADVAKDDWPAARRNVERALVAIDRLREKKARAERAKRKQQDVAVARPKPKSKPDVPPPPRTSPPTETPRSADKPPPTKTPSDLESGELPAEEVARLFDLLAAKERAKLDARRASRAERTADVEKDW